MASLERRKAANNVVELLYKRPIIPSSIRRVDGDDDDQQRRTRDLEPMIDDSLHLCWSLARAPRLAP
jgi:hypothetical protein